jgi:hypothetical protein
MVRDCMFGIGPLVSLAVATNLLAALTGSASADGASHMTRVAENGTDPGLMHRIDRRVPSTSADYATQRPRQGIVEAGTTDGTGDEDCDDAVHRHPDPSRD